MNEIQYLNMLAAGSEPHLYKEVMKHDHAGFWLEACQHQYNALPSATSGNCVSCLVVRLLVIGGFITLKQTLMAQLRNTSHSIGGTS